MDKDNKIIGIVFSGERPEYIMKNCRGGCSVREERAKLKK